MGAPTSVLRNQGKRRGANRPRALLQPPNQLFNNLACQTCWSFLFGVLPLPVSVKWQPGYITESLDPLSIALTNPKLRPMHADAAALFNSDLRLTCPGDPLNCLKKRRQ